MNELLVIVNIIAMTISLAFKKEDKLAYVCFFGFLMLISALNIIINRS